jgi:hypothetical protein
MDKSNNQQLVDWDEVAHSFWGQTPFTSHMSLPEINHLLGWATNLQDPRESSKNRAYNNPLDSLPNDPLPPSILAYLNHVASQILDGSTGEQAQMNNDWDSYNTSALDAVAVVLEEMITATLLPLAEQHVQRCRKLESDSEEAAFVAWTLPPEEALFELMRENGTVNMPTRLSRGLSTALPPQRAFPSTQSQDRSKNNSAEEEAIARWCRSHNLDRQFVSDNMDVFGLLLPSIKNSNDSH